MLKLVNERQRMIDDMVESIVELYPGQYKRVMMDKGKCNGIIRQNFRNPVSVLVGSGSGNEPWCIGYVGEGLADGAVIGPVFTAPTSRAVLAVTRNLPNKNGVVYICTNHAGDVLNFELASELAEMEGITTRTVVVTDDISSAPRENRGIRQGMAGVLLVTKIASGAASMGMNIEDVTRLATKANENTYTFSVFTSPVYNPLSGKTLMDLEEGMVEYGGGFSGESGVRKAPFQSANDTVDTVIKYLLNEIQPLPQEEIVALVNGFGRTSEMEMAIVGRRVLYNLRLNEINVHHVLMERAFCPQDSGGFSVSIMSMDEELRRCYDVPAWSPMIHGFNRAPFIH